eukprot:363982-Chlamydomonas_euryale.AAC.5
MDDSNAGGSGGSGSGGNSGSGGDAGATCTNPNCVHTASVGVRQLIQESPDEVMHVIEHHSVRPLGEFDARDSLVIRAFDQSTFLTMAGAWPRALQTVFGWSREEREGQSLPDRLSLSFLSMAAAWLADSVTCAINVLIHRCKHAHPHTHACERASMQYMQGGSRAFTLMWNRGGVVRAQIIYRGRRSRPITRAEAEAGPRPRTCMHVTAPRPPASGILGRKCMHVRGRGPASGSACVIGRGRRLRQAVIGRDRRPRQAYFVQG